MPLVISAWPNKEGLELVSKTQTTVSSFTLVGLSWGQANDRNLILGWIVSSNLIIRPLHITRRRSLSKLRSTIAAEAVETLLNLLLTFWLKEASWNNSRTLLKHWFRSTNEIVEAWFSLPPHKDSSPVALGPLVCDARRCLGGMELWRDESDDDGGGGHEDAWRSCARGTPSHAMTSWTDTVSFLEISLACFRKFRFDTPCVWEQHCDENVFLFDKALDENFE